MAATLALAPACSQTSGQVPGPVDGEPRIRLGAAPSGQRTVDVEGLPAEDLAHLEQHSAGTATGGRRCCASTSPAPPRPPRTSRPCSEPTACTTARCASRRGFPSIPVSVTRSFSIRRPCHPCDAVPYPCRCARSARRSRFRLRSVRLRPGWSRSIRRLPKCRQTTSGCTSPFPRRWVWEKAPRTYAFSTSMVAHLPMHSCLWRSTYGTRTARGSPFCMTRGASNGASSRTRSWAARLQRAGRTRS